MSGREALDEAIDPLDAADARDALAIAAVKLAKLSRAFERAGALDAQRAADAARTFTADARDRAADAAAHAIAETTTTNNDHDRRSI